MNTRFSRSSLNFLITASVNVSHPLFHNVLVAASRQPGKVEGTDDIAGYAALREPYQEWGPMLGNGAAADVVQFIKDVGASVQDAGTP